MKNYFSTRFSYILVLISFLLLSVSFLIYSYKLIANENNTDNIAAIIYDQSQLVTHTGQGSGGADASAVVSPNVNNGFNGSNASFFWLADDFVVPPDMLWHIDSIRFYVYQGGSPPPNPSPITNCKLIILKGNNNNPDSTGSTVAYGDTVTNRMKRSAFANMYRVPSTNLLDTQRPIDFAVDTVNVLLNPGTYWLKYNFIGNSTYSGPWGPCRTILNQNNTGNAKQKVPGVGWTNIIDTGSASTKGMAFIIYGTQIPIQNIQKTGNEVPSKFSLLQNYPNPFNPNTVIRYSLLKNGHVLLKVYDVQGREISTLVNEYQKAGTYETQFPNNQYTNNQLPSGVYFYKLTAGEFVDTKQMMLIK